MLTLMMIIQAIIDGFVGVLGSFIIFMKVFVVGSSIPESYT